MANRKETFLSGEYYHVYNRGNSKQDIFISNEDRIRFVKLLYICNSQKTFKFRDDVVDKKINAWDFERGDNIVSIGAWVLMPNHFHLYLTPRSHLGDLGEENNDVPNISLFIKKLCTSYSMYFNKKYRRTGKLFEGPFKSVCVSGDNQAKYIFSYIHLNPVKLIEPRWKEEGIKNIKQAINFLDSYHWSSYHEYRHRTRAENKILNQDDFPDYFSSPGVFDEEILDWLSFPQGDALGTLGILGEEG